MSRVVMDHNLSCGQIVTRFNVILREKKTNRFCLLKILKDQPDGTTEHHEHDCTKSVPYRQRVHMFHCKYRQKKELSECLMGSKFQGIIREEVISGVTQVL